MLKARGQKSNGVVSWSTWIPGGSSVNLRRTSFASEKPSRVITQQRTAAKRARTATVSCDEGRAVDQGNLGIEPAKSASEKYFERLTKVTEAESALTNPYGLKKSYEILRFDRSTGDEGPRDRYVYVEEKDCIGCTHCATTATGTFFMEPEHGRARVFDQMGDVEASVELAIDTCPVNCIYYVDLTDLVALEDMREGQVINNMARLVGGQNFLSSKTGDVKTKVMDSGIMRCENCPKRGCAECPLYGVGENPEYKRKQAQRQARAAQRKDDKKKTRRRI